jgi:hypothetical protein
LRFDLPATADGAMEEKLADGRAVRHRRYTFAARPAGTRWYHSHDMAGTDLTGVCSWAASSTDLLRSGLHVDARAFVALGLRFGERLAACLKNCVAAGEPFPAAHREIFVDDWAPRPNKKLTPQICGALIAEAHNQGLRVTAHMRELEDAKGLLRTGVDALAHSVRDKDVDAEGLALFKQRANLIVNPNLPDRGVRVDLSRLRASMSDAGMVELEKTQRRQSAAAGSVRDSSAEYR